MNWSTELAGPKLTVAVDPSQFIETKEAEYRGRVECNCMLTFPQHVTFIFPRALNSLLELMRRVCGSKTSMSTLFDARTDKSDVQKLLNALNEAEDIDRAMWAEKPAVVVQAFRKFLFKLPEPILTVGLYEELISAYTSCHHSVTLFLSQLRYLLLNRLPAASFLLLASTIKALKSACDNMAVPQPSTLRRSCDEVDDILPDQVQELAIYLAPYYIHSGTFSSEVLSRAKVHRTIFGLLILFWDQIFADRASDVEVFAQIDEFYGRLQGRQRRSQDRKSIQPIRAGMIARFRGSQVSAGDPDSEKIAPAEENPDDDEEFEVQEVSVPKAISSPLQPLMRTRSILTLNGYLFKLGKHVKNWKKRYFRMQENALYYYKGETDTKELGTVSLSNATVHTNTDARIEKRNSFSIDTGAREYFLFADTEDTRECWIGALRTLALNEDLNLTVVESEDHDVILYSGELSYRESLSKKWNKYDCTLSTDSLNLYKPNNSSVLLKCISLQAIFSVDDKTDVGGIDAFSNKQELQHRFQIIEKAGDSTHYFATEAYRDMRGWVVAIHKAMKKARTLRKSLQQQVG